MHVIVHTVETERKIQVLEISKYTSSAFFKAEFSMVTPYINTYVSGSAIFLQILKTYRKATSL